MLTQRTGRYSTASNQLAHRLHPAIDKVVRPAGVIGDRRAIRINAEIVIERREDFLEMHGPIFGALGKTIRRTDHLPRAHSSTGKQSTRDLRPMIAARFLVDSRR